MVKASALYIVIVISLIIAVLCSSLIVTGYYYRAEYQRKFRYDRLRNNLQSGINILLATSDTSFLKKRILSLSENDQDSVFIKRTPWGLYQVGVVKAFAQKDSLYKTYSFASTIDSSKWSALYLIDEDRPVSISGKSIIRGDAYLPKAGIQQTYVDNKAYEGDKRMVIGRKYDSNKELPSLDSVRLRQIMDNFAIENSGTLNTDSITVSFLNPTKFIDLNHDTEPLSNLSLSGNIILRSDTTLTIDSTVELDNVLIFARSIIVKSGFKGNCQLFASDSISIGKNCHFEYPSAAGLVRFVSSSTMPQARISLGEHTNFEGILFTYQKGDGKLKPVISLNKADSIRGQIYSQGILEYKDKVVIEGSILTSRFNYRNTFTLYENYLINITIDSKSLPSSYLNSAVMPQSDKKRKRILKWVEGN